jgi:hypothetical protein
MDKTILEPAGMLLVCIGITVWLMWRHERKRTESLRAIATSLGAILKPKVAATEMAALLDRSRLGSHGHVCALTNLMEIAGTDELRIQVFEYYYCIGPDATGTHLQQTVLRVQSPMLNLSEFVAHPEPFLYEYGEALGLQNINFPNDREFDRTFTVQGRDEAATRAVFTPAVIRFFREHPRLVLEGDGDRLLLYHPAKTLNPDELAVFVEEGKQATALIFGAVRPAAYRRQRAACQAVALA